MTGPRRPPARGGAATLGRPPAASGGSTRSSTDRTRAGRSVDAGAAKALKSASKPARSAKPAKAKSPKSPKAARSPKPATSSRSASGGAQPASASARASRSSERSTTRAMSRVDGPRGRRDGAGEEARRRKVRRRARIMVGVAVTVLLVGVLFVAVLPTPTFLQQRSDTNRLDTELAEIQAERAEVQAEIDRLGTDAEIEAQARRSGYVQPGEEAYNVLPTPIDPIGLPETWPFTGVEEAIGVR